PPVPGSSKAARLSSVVRDSAGMFRGHVGRNEDGWGHTTRDETGTDRNGDIPHGTKDRHSLRHNCDS
ncbi:MAG: hypothetical protein ACK46M_20015, partial [Planctomyces sp.]